MSDPQTPAAWQEAVDLCEAALSLWTARRLKLITRGPGVDKRRCEELLRLGRERGFTPRPGAADRLINTLKYWTPDEKTLA